MNRSLLILLTATALSACSDPPGGDALTNANRQTGGGAGTNHSSDPSGAANGAALPQANAAQVQAVSSPEVTSRLHSCGKMSVSSLRELLASRGFTGGGQRPDNTPSAQDVMDQDETPATLGGPNYDSRVPEAPFSSTAATSKMFDIFSMASYDGVASDWTAPACPNVKLLGTDGKFTKDGISCLIGKPASDQHVALANDAITKNPTDGAKVAIAALLSAAHTCQ